MTKTSASALLLASLDPTLDLADLLRQALDVALAIDDLEAAQWITQELKGYAFPDYVPKYRELTLSPGYFEYDDEYYGGRGRTWTETNWRSAEVQKTHGHMVFQLGVEQVVKKHNSDNMAYWFTIAPAYVEVPRGTDPKDVAGGISKDSIF